MNIKIMSTVKLDFPVKIKQDEMFYLLQLNQRKNCLYVKETKLIGRKYMYGSVKENENISTTQLRNLIDKGYLVSISVYDGYTQLIPNLNIISYLINKNNARGQSEYHISLNEGLRFMVVKLLTTSERRKLLEKSKKLNVNYGYDLQLEALNNGINEPMLIKKDGIYMVILDNNVYQVTLTKKRIPKEEDVMIGISLSTIIIHVNKKDVVSYGIIDTYTYDEIINLSKEANEYLTNNGVKITGYDKFLEKADNLKQSYSKLLKEYLVTWGEVKRLGKELEKNGIYVGGEENNPSLGKIDQLIGKLESIRTNESFRFLTFHELKFSNILETGYDKQEFKY